MNKIPTLAIVLVAIGLGSLVISLTSTAYNAMSYPNGSSQGMMGQAWNGMMGNGRMGGGMMNQDMGMMNTPISTIDNATFNSINTPPTGVAVNKAKNAVFINTTSVTIPIEAAPLWYPESGEYWLVYGLVNPTILVKQGTEVHFLFINMDNEPHVAAITTLASPYQYMPMMSGMMGGGGAAQSAGTWLAIGPMLAGVANSASNQNVAYSDATLSVTFDNTGTFWYPCVYPGHAQMGMYGEIQVVN